MSSAAQWTGRPTSADIFRFASVAIVWRLKAVQDAEFPRWTLGFPILVLFLLEQSVLAAVQPLSCPGRRRVEPPLFVAFQLADVGVFVTRFSWFGTMIGLDSGLAGLPIGAFEIAVVVRAAILLLCVVAWVRRSETTLTQPLVPARVAVVDAAD